MQEYQEWRKWAAPAAACRRLHSVASMKATGRLIDPRPVFGSSLVAKIDPGQAAMFDAFRCQAPRLKAAAARAATSLPDQAAVAVAAATPPRAAKRRRQEGGGGAAAEAPQAAAAKPPAGLALEKMGDQPLRLVIVGHNPSEHAW